VSFALIVFLGLTGYIGQEDDLYFWREAFKVHFLGGRSNLVDTLSTTKRIRGVFVFILLPVLLLHPIIEH
jgi:hypothetical protein